MGHSTNQYAFIGGAVKNALTAAQPSRIRKLAVSRNSRRFDDWLADAVPYQQTTKQQWDEFARFRNLTDNRADSILKTYQSETFRPANAD